ncbi:MAG TPA: DinB family protein [Bryobacteraceae bacterium]|nr:DinB family protein [Bryobacteraceae bacterium]
MKTIAALFFGYALLLPTVQAQPGKWKDEFVKHLTTSKAFTLDVANAMPAESYDFKPNPEEMSYGELMVHIAQSQSNAFARATGGKSPLAKPAVLDKATVVKYLTDAFDYCLKSLGDMEADGAEKMSGPEGKQMSARETMWAYFTHTAHHRGQAEVYLRVKGIKPPAYRF